MPRAQSSPPASISGIYRSKRHITRKVKSNLPNQTLAIQLRLKQMRDGRLISASMKNNTEVIKILLAMGANPDSTDMAGRSALHLATSKGYKDVVELLLQYGANPNICDSLDNTPLHLAACIHNLPIITSLIKAGADVRKLDIYGKNPLQLAKSKLQLLQESFRNGCVELKQIRNELMTIIELLIAVHKHQNREIDHLEVMKMNHSQPLVTAEAIDDQMTALLEGLEDFRIS